MDSILPILEQLLGLGLDPKELHLGQMALRALVIFIAGIGLLRFGHKRFFARRNAVDVLLAFVIASTLARAINGSAPFFRTIAVAFVLVLLHRLFAWAASRWQIFDCLLKGYPVELIRDGVVNEQVLREHDLSRGDLEEDLRIQGMDDPAQVRCATLERNGQISILRRNPPNASPSASASETALV